MWGALSWRLLETSVLHVESIHALRPKGWPALTMSPRSTNVLMTLPLALAARSASRRPFSCPVSDSQSGTGRIVTGWVVTLAASPRGGPFVVELAGLL